MMRKSEMVRKINDLQALVEEQDRMIALTASILARTASQLKEGLSES